jgi:hypothetical protein
MKGTQDFEHKNNIEFKTEGSTRRNSSPFEFIHRGYLSMIKRTVFLGAVQPEPTSLKNEKLI